jgi:hypothetical protein
MESEHNVKLTIRKWRVGYDVQDLGNHITLRYPSEEKGARCDLHII